MAGDVDDTGFLPVAKADDSAPEIRQLFDAGEEHLDGAVVHRSEARECGVESIERLLGQQGRIPGIAPEGGQRGAAGDFPRERPEVLDLTKAFPAAGEHHGGFLEYILGEVVVAHDGKDVRMEISPVLGEHLRKLVFRLGGHGEGTKASVVLRGNLNREFLERFGGGQRSGGAARSLCLNFFS